MFTLIRNYKNLFILTMYNALQNSSEAAAPVDTQVPTEPTTPEWEKVKEEAKEMEEAVKGVTMEQLKDLKAATEFFNRDGRTVLEKGWNNPKAAVIDIQEMFIFLGADLWKWGSNGNGVDGDFGSTMLKVVTAFQNENGLSPDGQIWKLTYAKILEKVGAIWGMSEKKADQKVAEVKKDVSTVDQAQQALSTRSERSTSWSCCSSRRSKSQSRCNWYCAIKFR